MKRIIFFLSCLLATVPAVAQQAGAIAGSQSQSGSAAQANSGSIGYGAGGHGGSASANNAGNNQSLGIVSYGSDLSRAHKNTPSVVAPALSSTLTDTCMGSITGGVSGAGFGVAGGKTYVDQECVRRLHSKFLAGAGQGEVAMQIMCGSPFVAEAAATLAARTQGVDKCTGESYAILEPVTPKDGGVGPIPLLGPDAAEAIDAGIVLTEEGHVYVDDSFTW